MSLADEYNTNSSVPAGIMNPFEQSNMAMEMDKLPDLDKMVKEEQKKKGATSSNPYDDSDASNMKKKKNQNSNDKQTNGDEEWSISGYCI